MTELQTYAFPVLESTGPRVTFGGGSASQAADLLAQAEAEAAAIRSHAAEVGYQEGRDAGLAEARERLAPVGEVLEAAAQALIDAREEICTLAEVRSAELAIAIAEKIVGSALELRPELVLEIAAAGIRRAVERDSILLLVNPDDLEIVRAGAADLAASLGGIHRIEVASERRVGRGGCIVRTDEGEIDARIAEQLDRVREVVAESFAPSA